MVATKYEQMAFASFILQNRQGGKPDPNFPAEIRIVMPEDPDMIVDSQKWNDYADLNHGPVCEAFGVALSAFQRGEKVPMLAPGVYTTIRVTGTTWEICVNPDCLVAVPKSGYHTGVVEKWTVSAYFTVAHIDDRLCHKLDLPNGEPVKVSRKITGRKAYVDLVRLLGPRLRIFGEPGGTEAITMTGFDDSVDSLTMLFNGAAPYEWTYHNTDRNEYAGTKKIVDLGTPVIMSYNRGDDDVTINEDKLKKWVKGKEDKK